MIRVCRRCGSKPRIAGSATGFAVPAVVAALLALPAAAQIVPGPGGDIPPPFPPNFEVDENRTEVIEPTSETARSSTATITTRISDTIARALRPDQRGRQGTSDDAARLFPRRSLSRDGDSGLDGALAAWVTGTATFLESDASGARFDGEIYTPLAGLDYVIDGGWVFGLALGYERIDLDTDFNGGDLEADGFVVSPYIGKTLGAHAIIDAGIGYVRLDYDRTSQVGPERRAGSFDADRLFLFTNLTGYAPAEWHGVEGLELKAKAGFRYAREDQGAFDEGPVRVPGGVVELGQISLSGEVRYFPEIDAVAGLELFVRAEGNYDAIRTERAFLNGVPLSDDRTDVTLGLGAAATVVEGVTVDLSYQRVFSREDITEQSVLAGLRIEF